MKFKTKTMSAETEKLLFGFTREEQQQADAAILRRGTYIRRECDTPDMVEIFRSSRHTQTQRNVSASIPVFYPSLLVVCVLEGKVVDTYLLSGKDFYLATGGAPSHNQVIVVHRVDNGCWPGCWPGADINHVLKQMARKVAAAGGTKEARKRMIPDSLSFLLEDAVMSLLEQSVVCFEGRVWNGSLRLPLWRKYQPLLRQTPDAGRRMRPYVR